MHLSLELLLVATDVVLGFTHQMGI